MARVVLTRRALAQVTEARAWWRENRRAAPDLLESELARAVALLTSQPLIGARARNASLGGVRRLHLANVRYHLYYRALDEGSRVEILALWHSSRGSGPRL